MRRTSRAFALSVATALCVAAQGHAQLPVLVEGIADGELWSTTRASNLLTRNAGRPAGLARVQMWAAVEPLPRLVFYAQGELESGPARFTPDGDRYQASANQFGVRFSPRDYFVVDAGKLQPVLGTFASRRFSNRNPLIGAPDGYTLDYPYGVVVSGETKHFDYRAAMVDLPASHEGYVPEATRRFRPAVGFGITPFVGFRVGGSFTVGSYLNRGLTPTQLRNEEWSSYQQRIVALDLRFARGYFEARAEAARGEYDVPGASPIFGYNYYGELKYTFTPRLFVATRAERNNYPFIRPFGTTWTARLRDFVNGEVGVGYRATASTLVKASVRGDRWWVAANSQGFLGQGGKAVAVQVSQAFDVVSWFTRAQ